MWLLIVVPFHEGTTKKIRRHTIYWTAHPEADVAVLRLDGPQPMEIGVSLDPFSQLYDTITLEQAREMKLSEGDGVFVLGFLLGSAGRHTKLPDRTTRSYRSYTKLAT